jgi:hypothetical protein
MMQILALLRGIALTGALTLGALVLLAAGPAYADGGGVEADTGSSTAPKPKKPKQTGTTATPPTSPPTSTTTGSTAKTPKPPCWKYKQSKIRKIRDVQSKLAGYAKKDKLKGLATNLKRLENFAAELDKMGANYSGWKSVEFNLIYLQLRCYANQKQDKELRKLARGILQALAVIKERDHAKAKREKWRKAKAEKNPIKTVLAEAEYSDARGDYHRAAKKLPKEMKALFKPLSKNPAN